MVLPFFQVIFKGYYLLENDARESHKPRARKRFWKEHWHIVLFRSELATVSIR